MQALRCVALFSTCASKRLILHRVALGLAERARCRGYSEPSVPRWLLLGASMRACSFTNWLFGLVA